MLKVRYLNWRVVRQPLREAVSWNDDLTAKAQEMGGQPLREAVSWNCPERYRQTPDHCQPLREAVSWNISNSYIAVLDGVSLFVRLWVEMELKSRRINRQMCQPLREAVSWNTQKKKMFVEQCTVSLFVRLWVEMTITFSDGDSEKSASSWGCELKYLELYYQPQAFRRQPLREAVSWNVTIRCSYNNVVCQPLREAVSWNVLIALNTVLAVVSLFVRLWVEMSDNWRLRKMTNRQPLREAVSWNNFSLHNGWLSILSASSWGCELKYNNKSAISATDNVSLFVRLWVEIPHARTSNNSSMSASSWGCELKCIRSSGIHFCHRSASSWGCELKCAKRCWNRPRSKGQPLREAVSWNIRM